MTPIQTNKPVFFGEDGEVLRNGTIYIGQPITDPRTNPKTVTFQDSAGAQFSAGQPLSTNDDGRISYNGKPIIALVDGEFSSLSFDSQGKQVDYTPLNAPVSGGPTMEGFGDLIRVGLTIDDVKGFDVAVSNIVKSVGSALPQDGKGEEWLAVSNTGTPGDDVDLIDFENGLQGRRVTSKKRLVWTGSSDTVNVSALSDTEEGYFLVETAIGRFLTYFDPSSTVSDYSPPRITFVGDVLIFDFIQVTSSQFLGKGVTADIQNVVFANTTRLIKNIYRV